MRETKTARERDKTGGGRCERDRELFDSNSKYEQQLSAFCSGVIKEMRS